MRATLDAILRRFVAVGRLPVRWPDGQRTSYAGPPGSGPEAGIAIRDERTIRRLVLNPTLAVGEAYMDGGLIPDGCGIYDVIEVLALNVMANATGHPIARLRSVLGTHQAPHRPVQPGAARAAQRGASLRPERAALQPVPGSRPAIFLRLFPARRRDAGGSADRQEAAHRGETLSGSPGSVGARHRLRLGWAGADPGARSRRDR